MEILNMICLIVGIAGLIYIFIKPLFSDEMIIEKNGRRFYMKKKYNEKLKMKYWEIEKIVEL